MHPSPTFRQTAELYQSGLSLSEVGALLGVSHVAVRYRLVKAGIPRRNQYAPRKPMADIALALGSDSVVAVAKAFGESYDALKNRVYETRRFNKRAWMSVQPLSPEEAAMARDAFDVDGLSFPDVIEIIRDGRRQDRRGAA